MGAYRLATEVEVVNQKDPTTAFVRTVFGKDSQTISASYTVYVILLSIPLVLFGFSILEHRCAWSGRELRPRDTKTSVSTNILPLNLSVLAVPSHCGDAGPG